MALNFFKKWGAEKLINVLFKIIQSIIRLIGDIPPDKKEEVIDLLIDKIEANNHDNSAVMTACEVLRSILGVPDDDIDQTKPR